MCTVAFYLPYAVFCSCTRVPCCIMVAFCRVLQLYARSPIAFNLPFVVFCSCTRVLCCILVAFCRVLQLSARAVLHSSCLLPWFAAVRACRVAFYLPFTMVCGCPLVPCCIMVAFRRFLLYMYTYGHAVLHSIVALFGVCCSCTHLLCCISIPRAVLQSVAFLACFAF
jgi:hypothetical protein